MHRSNFRFLLAGVCLSMALGCSDDDNSNNANNANNANNSNNANNVNNVNNVNNANNSNNANNMTTDITDAVFSNDATDCSAYIGSYSAMVTDIGNSTDFVSSVEITANGDGCTITSNSIPNHDFNDAGAFANAVAEVTETFNLPVPEIAAQTTALSLATDNAIFLNGVKLDQLAAACYGVGNEPLGQEKIGCMQEGQPWRYDPMSPNNSFGTDSNNAHTQPDGAYHYHGDPNSMYDDTGDTAIRPDWFCGGRPPHLWAVYRRQRKHPKGDLRLGIEVRRPC